MRYLCAGREADAKQGSAESITFKFPKREPLCLDFTGCIREALYLVSWVQNGFCELFSCDIARQVPRIFDLSLEPVI